MCRPADIDLRATYVFRCMLNSNGNSLRAAGAAQSGGPLKKISKKNQKSAAVWLGSREEHTGVLRAGACLGKNMRPAKCAAGAGGLANRRQATNSGYFVSGAVGASTMLPARMCFCKVRQLLLTGATGARLISKS